MVESVLETAQQNLAEDGSLAPALFLDVGREAYVVTPLRLPELTGEKQAYFTALGRSLAKQGMAVKAALFLSETWFVNAQTMPGALTVPPSQHPGRQEAIMVTGRDAQGVISRAIMVLPQFV